MDVVSLVIKIVLCLCSLFLIVVVLLQSDENGANSMLSGMQASRSKARGMNAMLAKLTKIAAVIFMILAAAWVLIQRFF